MTCKLLSRSLLAALVLGAFGHASAQTTITARGLVQDTGTVIKMMYTPLKLTGNTVNLQNLVGTWIEATGTLGGAQNLDVVTATPITDIFTIGNGGVVHPGGTLQLDIQGPAGRIEQLHWSLDNSFHVVKKMSWFLNSPAFQLTQGVIPVGGSLSFVYSVQNDPSLVGIKVFLQDVRQDLGGTFELGNIDSFTVS